MNPTATSRNCRPLRQIMGIALLAASLMGQHALALEPDSTSSGDFQRFSALPVLGYSEETRLQYGAMALLFFKPNEPGGKVQEIDITAYGSTRGQFQFLFVPYFYLYHDKISGIVDFRYQNWVGSYFGTGNDVDFDEYLNFDRERLHFSTELKSSVGLPSQFNYGLVLHAEKTTTDFKPCEKDDCTAIAIPETHPGWRNGGGYLLSYDSRDNLNWTRSGFLVRWQQMFYSDHLGDYSFETQSLDLRGFAPLFWNISMATAALWQRTSGDTPVDMLAGPDGTKRFRGVESLYFRDNQGLILQAELRKYLGWRLAGDIFFEGAKVGDHFSELMRNEWHQSVGFGGMLALNLKERLYARGEISWVDYKKLGMTVYIRSAF